MTISGLGLQATNKAVAKKGCRVYGLGSGAGGLGLTPR